MTQISDSSPRSDRYAICVPSGDHDGSNSNAGECVSRVRSVPSASIVHTSSWLSKTMRPERGVKAEGSPVLAERVAVEVGAESEPLGADPPEQATRSMSTAAESRRRVFIHCSYALGLRVGSSRVFTPPRRRLPPTAAFPALLRRDPGRRGSTVGQAAWPRREAAGV